MEKALGEYVVLMHISKCNYEWQNLIWNEILWDMVIYSVNHYVIMNAISFTISFEILHTI